jgi:hypothetical protein
VHHVTAARRCPLCHACYAIDERGRDRANIASVESDGGSGIASTLNGMWHSAASTLLGQGDDERFADGVRRAHWQCRAARSAFDQWQQYEQRRDARGRSLQLSPMQQCDRSAFHLPPGWCVVCVMVVLVCKVFFVSFLRSLARSVRLGDISNGVMSIILMNMIKQSIL